MKVHKGSGLREVAIDMSKPIIEFNPWPFKSQTVGIVGKAWFCDLDGRLSGPSKNSGGLVMGVNYNFLGTTTDGDPVVIHDRWARKLIGDSK